ncbi:DUF7173 family protein [Magnetococcus sp. PR-3]|uniref:DUF7173 family protein n=1 Tax=Magnetococcus sp. PR-3 TaxID=3120355 RepID=UPI002FCE3A60
MSQPQPTELDQALFELQEAKNVEKVAKDAVLAAEQRVIDLAGVKEEGSQTTKSTYYKVTTTGNVRRSVDREAWDKIKDQLPENVTPFTTKVEVNRTKLNALKDHNPELYTLAAGCVTSKQGKSSVKFEALPQEGGE